MNLKSKILELHPDFNGGDVSRVDEFTALMAERRQREIENRRCKCGCGEKVFRASRSPKYNAAREYFSRLCFIRHRFYDRLLPAAMVLACALLAGCMTAPVPPPPLPQAAIESKVSAVVPVIIPATAPVRSYDWNLQTSTNLFDWVASNYIYVSTNAACRIQLATPGTNPACFYRFKRL